MKLVDEDSMEQLQLLPQLGQVLSHISTRKSFFTRLSRKTLSFLTQLVCAIYRQKDTNLIKQVLDEDDWDCIKQLIKVLKPLKEASLMVSTNGQALMITRVIPIYYACTEMLQEAMRRFDYSDDIYIGINAAVEKLNHYYDKISPMVGIALILDPTMKKDYLTTNISWKAEWVESVN
jgi:hypothetical protein